VGELVAVIWYENAVPIVAVALVELVITGAETLLLLVSVSVAVPVPPLFVAFNVMVDVPAAVGVPEITPVPLLIDRPAGNPLAP
jgi:hypothetical protein